jgi:hypothetical protein
MDEGLAILLGAIIGALAGGLGGFLTAKMQFRQKDDELLLIALKHLGGGSQERNVGVSGIELYWNNSRHKDVCLSLLIGSAIYLLRDSEQGDKDIELYNLQRIMDFILEHGQLTESLRTHYEMLSDAIDQAKIPKSAKSLKVKPNDLKNWQNKMSPLLGKQKAVEGHNNL